MVRKKAETPSFEEGLKRLETIVEQLESGELPRTPDGEALTEVGRLIPKRLFNICVPDEKAAAVVQAIIAANSTGHPGDGKIFVMPVGESYVVRTGERTDA